MHLEFVNDDDGTILNLDVDVSPPSIPFSRGKTRDKWGIVKGEEPEFDGSNAAKRAWLEKMRMPGWLTEWIKTEDMSDGASEDSSRSIRLRFINPEEVIVEQCILFLKGGDPNGKGGTLSGNKLLVYVIMKILKKCTDAKLQSFKIKFAVFNALAHSRYETGDIGTSLERVLRYLTLRGKFDGVHPELAKIGVKKIKVEKNGLTFDGE